LEDLSAVTNQVAVALLGYKPVGHCYPLMLHK